MPCQYSRAFSASILLLLAFVSLASAAATYAINFTTDAAGANIASSVTQCGTAIYANTNVTCSAASKCTWSILGIAYNTSARFSDKSCPSAFEFVGQIDKDKTTPSIKIAGCAGVGKSVTVAVTNGSATASATLMVIPADPTNMQVCGKGDRCSTNPTSAIEGANITYIAFLDTNMGALGGDCSSYAYLSQEDKGVSDTINDFLNRMRGLPRYQESPPVEVHINQTVRFRNWTKIYANIASGALTESNIADALKPTNTAYTYDVNLTTKQCQDAQSSGDYCTLQCTNPARLDKTQTWPNINGAVPFSLTAYRDAVWVESNFTVGSTQKQTITDPATGRTYEANVFTLYPSGGDQGKSFKVNVQFFRPVKGYGLANNASMPFESEVRNFYLNVTAMDASGLPTNMSGIGGCTTGGNSLIFPNILSINVSSGYVKNFVVNLSSSGMGCPTTPTLSDPATEQQWYVYNCTSYKGSFIPKKLEMGISKPGLYKVTVSSIEGAQLLDCAKFPLPGIPIWVEAKGAVKIVVQGVPRNVSVEAPPEWFEWVPFDVNLSLRDGAGKVVTGNAYNVSLSIASGSVGNYAVKTPAGDSCVSPATCNCTTGLLSGKCTIRLRAEAPLNSDNPELKFTGVYHGKSTIRPGKDCPIGGAGYCPADGTATTKIWESQCANFTVSPPPGPVEIADKAIAQNLSYLVNEANAKNYLMGPLLVGMDPSTQTMGGNASLCYDQPPQRVELCVNATSGMFVTPPGAGLMCIKEYIYTPEVDGAISDHLNFGDMNLSRKKLLETFYYPRVVWGWGFIGPNSTPQSTCGFLAPPGQGTHGGKGYIIKFPAQPEFPGEGDYFNITATSVRNISLPSYNITWDKAGAALGYSSGGLSGCTCDAGNPQCCASPHMITGMDALLVVDDSADAVANGGALRMFGMDGTYREKYPFYSDDYGLITPQSIISDKRGNIFVADTGHRRIVIFKLANVSYAKGLPSIQKIQLVPDKLELTPPSITGATEYDPMGVSLDTFNRLFIAGLTNPGQEENYLVIQVYGPDLKTAVANYSELRPYATHADISVDPQGVFIYVADDEKKIRQFAYTETPQSCLTASLPGSDQQICETSGSRGKTSSGNQGYHLYIPCRHLGSGCWDSNCGLAAANGGRGFPWQTDWLNAYDYTGDLCSPMYMEDNWGSIDDMLSEGNQDAYCGPGTSGQPMDQQCHNLTTARMPEHDNPDVDHKAVAVFDKKGYVFVIDKLDYNRTEEWSGCADNLCGCGSIAPNQCNSGPAIRYQGCETLISVNWCGLGDSLSFNCYDWTHHNRCGSGVTKQRTEYWLRVFREDQTQGNALVPVYNGAFKQATFSNSTGDERGGACGGSGSGSCDSSNFPYALGGDKLYAGHYRGAYDDTYGWQYTAGRGTAQQLNITEGDTSGLFVDDDFNVYITVASPMLDGSTDKNFVYKFTMTLSPQGGWATTPQVLVSGTANLNTPHDVLAFPDVIKQTLSQGVYCEGCSDKGAISLDVCNQEEQKVSAGASVSTGGGFFVKPLAPVLVQVDLNTSIEGKVRAKFDVSVQEITCGSASGTEHTVTLYGDGQATSNWLQADVEGGMFKLAFMRPYRLIRDPSGPHTLPILSYEAYSSRLMAKHFVVLGNLPPGAASNNYVTTVCGDDDTGAKFTCTEGAGTPQNCAGNDAACGNKSTATSPMQSCTCISGKTACGKTADDARAACWNGGSAPNDPVSCKCKNDKFGRGPTEAAAKDACKTYLGSESKDPAECTTDNTQSADCKANENACGTYGTAFTPRILCECKINAGMVNSSYRLNYTLLQNNYSFYTQVNTSVDVYGDVSSTSPSNRRYDVGAQPYLPALGSVSPWPSGYANASINWSFIPQFVYVPERYVKNPMPLNLTADPHKFYACAELSPNEPLAYGNHTVNVSCDVAMAAADCASAPPCLPGQACKVRDCSLEEKADHCVPPGGTDCHVCYYEVKRPANNVTNSPVIVQIGGYDTTGIYIEDTFDIGELTGKSCTSDTAFWTNSTRGNQFENITKVVVSAPRNGETMVKICPPAGCGDYYFAFNSSTGIPDAAADHHKISFGYVPANTLKLVDNSTDQVLAPGDPLDGKHGYALKIQPVKSTGMTSITVMGYTNFTGDLFPLSGFATTGGYMGPNPVEGRIGFDFDYYNDAPEQLHIHMWYNGLNGAGSPESYMLIDQNVAPGSGATASSAHPDFTRLDNITIATNGTGTGFISFKFFGKSGNPVRVTSSSYYHSTSTHGNDYYLIPDAGGVISNGTKFINDMQNMTVQVAEQSATTPRSGPFYLITDVRGQGGDFGDKYYVWQDTAVVINAATLTADRNGNIAVAADSLYDLSRTPAPLQFSAHRNACCDKRDRAPFESFSDCRECKDATNPNCTTASEAPAAVSCASQNYYTPNEQTGSVMIIGRTARLCSGGSNAGSVCGTDSDCPGSTCVGGELKSEAKDITASSNDTLVKLSGTKYSAIYRINITGGLNETMRVWAGDTAAFPILSTDVSTYPTSLVSRIGGFEPENRYIRVRSSNATSTATIAIEGADKTGVPVTMALTMGHSSEANSLAYPPVVEIYTLSVTGASPGDTFTVETFPFDQETPPRPPGVDPANPKSFGTIYLRTFHFTPYPYQDLDGFYMFSTKDYVNTQILDEKVLGFHGGKYIFFDRFNNSFIWDQPFNFTLPTKLVLQVDARRDKKDANRTLVNLTATLYYSTLQEPNQAPSHPLGSPSRGDNIYINFYEYNVSDTPYVMETNDNTQDISTAGNTICTCPCVGADPRTCETKCSNANGQTACTTDANCGGAGACMGGTLCQSDDECTQADVCTYVPPNVYYCSQSGGTCWPSYLGGSGACPGASTGTCGARVCRGGSSNGVTCTKSSECPGGTCPLGRCEDSGRCLHSFGKIGDSQQTCSETDVAAGGRCEGSLSVGQASVEYNVCGWGRHRAIALFNGTKSYAPAVDIQAYYSGGLPLDIGALALWIPFAIVLLAIFYKLHSDAKKKPSRAHA